MEKELANGEIGAESGYTLKIIGGKAKLEIAYAGKQANAGLFIEVGIVQLLEEAAKATDNTIDDGLVSLVKVALGES